MNALPLIIPKDQKELSKIQETFNKKVREVAKLKKKLEDVKQNVTILENALQSVVMPLQKELEATRMQLIELLNEHYQSNNFTKKEKEKIALLVFEFVSEVLEISPDNTRAIELYNFYSPNKKSYQDNMKEIEDLEKDFLQFMSSSMGFKFDKEDFDSPENFFQKMQEMEEKFKQENFEEKNRKPKNAKEAQRLAKQMQERKNLNKAIKALYNDLAKQFHPDLADEGIKAEKEKVMQEITTAYEKGDVFTLLQMHITHIQNNQNDLEKITTEQLQYYIKFLNEQIKNIQREISLETLKYNYPYSDWLLKQNIQKKIDGLVKEIEYARQRFLEDIEVTKDIQAVKLRLKNYRIQYKKS
ncbi:MAG: hypothetical protein RMJ97_00990 [Raineya sp.]|nr:hypothetical protein [Raineya sp.]MDW8295432.1 hypothetical protein [Raineya sp.]